MNYENNTKEELIKLIQQLELDLENKKYGLVWDKEREPEQVVLDCQNNLPILKEIKDKHIKTDNSDDNILIEGDNYHALSVLNYTHENKIDVIYIDPPYNTGGDDFIYNDKFVDKDDKFRHSKWLNFMEKRINIAKNLLAKDGVLYISIGDDEVSNLRLLCDKIFGEINFITMISRVAKTASNLGAHFAPSTDYILVYANNKSITPYFKDEVDESLYKKVEKEGERKGEKYRDDVAFYQSSQKDLRPNQKYFIECPKDGSKLLPPCLIQDEVMIEGDGRWRWSKETYLAKKELLVFKQTKTSPLVDENGNKAKWNIYTKSYLKDRQISGTKPRNYLDSFINRKGADFLKTLDIKFNFSKPIDLIKYLIKITDKKNDITILDFFAGSGTTGQAILELNKEDLGSRKFIICTNNENDICNNVTYPRLYRVINGYTNSKNKIFDSLNGNMRYFQTELLEKNLSYYQTKINLVNECTEMLCVKENIYNLKIEEEDFKIFYSNDKLRYLAVYYNTEDDSLNNFLDELKNIKDEKIVYMFSETEELDQIIFRGIKNCKPRPIPQKILNIYHQLNKQNITPKTNTIFVDLDKAKRRIFQEKDKDDGASKLRIVLEQVIEYIAYKNGLNLNDFNSIARVNTKLKDDGTFTKVRWKENETYLTIGNDASHGDYDKYEMKQVKGFYKHIQSLITEFGVGK